MSKTTKETAPRRPTEATCATPPFPLCSIAHPSFEEAFSSVATILEGRKKVLVLAGAGMSVSCGIPDFRTEGSGLYSNLDVERLGLSCPEDLFDWEFFREDPAPFYRFARALYFPLGAERRVEPSDSHRFLALLEQRNMLLRVYTQNIDGLELIAGVSEKKMVYAHGSLRWATCMKCRHRVNASDIEQEIWKGTVPKCKQLCAVKQTGSPRLEVSRSKRPRPTVKNETSGNVCGGVLKPGVIFFGEPLNGNVKRKFEADRDRADALIVIGTSLSVAPMSHVIDFVPPHIPRILINRNAVHPPVRQRILGDDDEGGHKFREDYIFDIYLLGFCDDVTRALVREMGQMKDTRGKAGGRLLACLEEGDQRFAVQDWATTRLPANRVLLFPGAVSENSAFDYSYREVAHCDGCSRQICGTIRKCSQCFDFDLCETCFPELSIEHHDGKHTFSAELAG